MTSSKSFARLLALVLVAVFLPGPSLGPVLGDDAARPAAVEARLSPEATQQPTGETVELTEPAEPGCEPDLSIREATGDPAPLVLSPEEQVCPVDSLESLFPVRMGPPFGQGYCRCGCGLRCETSDDCGGAACVGFITCC